MIRRLLPTLLVMFALQACWGAISAYCTHETGRAAQHLGHHQHSQFDDSGSLAEKDQPAPSKKTAHHSHCSSCAHAALASGNTDESVMYLVQSLTSPLDIKVAFSSRALSPPERPQWMRTA